MSKISLGLLLVLCFASLSVSAQESSLPILDDLTIGEWQWLQPGGDAICTRGDPYEFMVRPAESEKLLIHFQGGGACWDGSTCAMGNGYLEEGGPNLFKQKVFDLETTFYSRGIFDLENPENPVGDFNLVMVNYCSGDVHTGDAQVTYTVPETDQDVTIEHRGSANANAVLAWTFENFPNPEQVFITGCSAGAYGSIYHAPTIMSQYAELSISQLADSGIGGLVAPDWDGIQRWNSVEHLPEFFQERARIDTVSQYITVADQFPQNAFSAFTTYADRTQVGFAALMNGVDEATQLSQAWSQDMLLLLHSIDDVVENFNYFVAGGDTHCILNEDYFYTYQADDIMFRDWVEDLLTGVAQDTQCDVQAGECEVASGD